MAVQRRKSTASSLRSLLLSSPPHIKEQENLYNKKGNAVEPYTVTHLLSNISMSLLWYTLTLAGLSPAVPCGDYSQGKSLLLGQFPSGSVGWASLTFLTHFTSCQFHPCCSPKQDFLFLHSCMIFCYVPTPQFQYPLIEHLSLRYLLTSATVRKAEENVTVHVCFLAGQ